MNPLDRLSIFCDTTARKFALLAKKQARPTAEPVFHPRPTTRAPKLVDLVEMTEEEFREKFNKSPVKRAKWRGLLRNVAAGLSSSDDPAAEAALVSALDHPEELVREQAASSLRILRARKRIS